MGLRNNNTMVTRSQLTAPVRTYMSIGTSPLKIITVSAGNYTLSFTSKTWKDQEARNRDVPPFDTTFYAIPIVERGMGANMYTTAYNHLKTIHTNTTDV